MLAEGAARDLAVTFGILFDKGQLLRGEPTQVRTYEQRERIHELIPALLNEAKRRGITIDQEEKESPVIGGEAAEEENEE